MAARFLWLALAWSPLVHSAVCDPKLFHGPYGFQLSGTTAISATPQPVVSIGRLVLDDSGGISGISSVKFAGLLLGNPVMGTYEAETDCTVSWSLQDDSGKFQHFEGAITADGERVTFHQSDPGGPHDGIMMRTGDSCSAADFQGRYSLTLSGSTMDVNTGQATGKASRTGLLEADGAGNLSYAPDPSAAFESAGAFEMEDDCFVRIDLELPSGGDGTSDWSFRAILANQGHDALGIESTPGTEVILRLVSK